MDLQILGQNMCCSTVRKTNHVHLVCTIPFLYSIHMDILAKFWRSNFNTQFKYKFQQICKTLEVSFFTSYRGYQWQINTISSLPNGTKAITSVVIINLYNFCKPSGICTIFPISFTQNYWTSHNSVMVFGMMNFYPFTKGNVQDISSWYHISRVLSTDKRANFPVNQPINQLIGYSVAFPVNGRTLTHSLKAMF